MHDSIRLDVDDFEAPPDDWADSPFPDTQIAESPNPLEKVDLSFLFGPDGPLAEQLAGYELRPSQLEMAEGVKSALLAQTTALIEAPTGTGKSIAYLLPAILSGKTVVVATANKSLQSQLFYKDLPFLRQVLNAPIEAVLVKGRSNYVCTYKWEQESAQQRLFAEQDQEHEQITLMRGWLEETESGDVDDLSFVLESDLRRRVVSFTDDCLQRDCPYYEDRCYVNQMRDRAAEAQVLVTNHHLLLNALELGFGGERILPPAPIYVIDEAHQLEETATAVFETSVTDFTVEQLLRRTVIQEQLGEDELDELRMQNTVAFQEVSFLSRDNSFTIETDLEGMSRLGHQLRDLWERMKKNNPYRADDSSAKDPIAPETADGEERGAYAVALETLGSTASKILDVATSKRDGAVVRYASRLFDRRYVTLEIHAAPLEPANLLSDFLFGEADRSVICTSATLATDGHFEHFKRRCGVVRAGIERQAPPVFDYPNQALLYQPALPAYDWRNKDAFYQKASAEIRRLLEVSRGRALCLFTNWSGLQLVREQLTTGETATTWPLRSQGDAPRDTLLSWFRETPYSVLLATKSFWEGVDIPGDDLSLVVLDKLPFPTPNDPLHSARMRALDTPVTTPGQTASAASGPGRSFGEYMVPLMTLTLKQGFGRLIRRASDRGVVAILDDRLTAKAYGRRARADLPPARFTRQIGDVHLFFRAALSGQADFALNVWADEEIWQWQLVRLQDGKTDQMRGALSGVATTGELVAIHAGLTNLRQRVEQAQRPPDQFGIEIRCSTETAMILEQGLGSGPQVRAAAEACSWWKNVCVIGLERTSSL